jgi:hypothetical protein
MLVGLFPGADFVADLDPALTTPMTVAERARLLASVAASAVALTDDATAVATGAWHRMPAATQTADRSKVVSVPPAGTPIGTRKRLTDDDYGAYALTFTNGGPGLGTLMAFLANAGGDATIEWDGTNWGLVESVQISAAAAANALAKYDGSGGLTAVQFNGTSFVIPSSAVNPTWMQSPAASGAGGRWIFQTQAGATPGTNAGGDLVVNGGTLIAGNAGGLKIENGAFETWSLWCDNSYARISGGGKGSALLKWYLQGHASLESVIDAGSVRWFSAGGYFELDGQLSIAPTVGATSGANAVNWNTGNHVKLGKLTGAASISAPTNPRPGATYVISWIGDGASVLTFNAAFLSGAAGKSNEILATAVANNKNAMARFYYDGSVYLCELFAVQG